MRPSDVFSMAFSNLWRRKLRTSLTVLAVVIGAALITLVVSLGSGLEKFIVDQFGLVVSQDAMTVAKIEDFEFGRESGNVSVQEIKLGDIAEIEAFNAEEVAQIRAIDGVERIDYYIMLDALYVTPQDSSKIYSVFVLAVTDYEMELRPLSTGEYFADDSTGNCILSQDYLDAFGWDEPEEALGKEITIRIGKEDKFTGDTKGYVFTVVGVSQQSMVSAEVLISNTEGIEMARFQQDRPTLYTDEDPGLALKVKVTDEEIINEVAAEIRDLNFSTITPAEILGEINSVFNTIQIVLAFFGAIALIVASIGIINTLIMAIYERTREIGIMKAVGATRGHIRLLFTLEGGALGLLGGIVGVGGAFILGQLLNFVGSKTFLSDFPNFNLSVFPLWLLVGVIALTTTISLIAGLYPANRAAGLDPIEALRYE